MWRIVINLLALRRLLRYVIIWNGTHLYIDFGGTGRGSGASWPYATGSPSRLCTTVALLDPCLTPLCRHDVHRPTVRHLRHWAHYWGHQAAHGRPEGVSTSLFLSPLPLLARLVSDRTLETTYIGPFYHGVYAGGSKIPHDWAVCRCEFNQVALTGLIWCSNWCGRCATCSANSGRSQGVRRLPSASSSNNELPFI